MPLEGIPWPAVGVGTMGWLLAFYYVHSVMSGKLIPWEQHRKQVERAEHDSNEWRTEGRIKDQQIAEKDTQLGYLRELANTVGAVMSAMQNRSDQRDRDNESGSDRQRLGGA